MTNPSKRAPLYDVAVGKGAVNALGFCPSSAGPSCAGILMIASENGTSFWDPEHPTAKSRRWDATAALSAAWAPDGSFAVGVDDTSNPGIVVVRHGSPGRRFIATADLVRSLTFADGARVLVSGGDDWNVTTWDVSTGRAFGPPRTQSASEVTSVAVSPDGATLAGAGANGVYLWPLHARGALATTVGSVGYGSRITQDLGSRGRVGRSGRDRDAVRNVSLEARLDSSGGRAGAAGPALASCRALRSVSAAASSRSAKGETSFSGEQPRPVTRVAASQGAASSESPAATTTSTLLPSTRPEP